MPMMMRPWLLLCAMLLSACAQSDPPVRLISPTVPGSLLAVPDLPDPPVADSQAAVARYLVDLHEVAAVCRERLIGVGQALQAP